MAVRALSAVLLASFFSLSGCAKRAQEDTRPVHEETATAPSASARDFDVPGLEQVSAGELVARMRQAPDKGTLVNAWASWCGPCRREVPMLQRLEAKLKAQGIAVVLVSVDEPADAPKAEAFLRENRIELKTYLAKRPLDVFKRELNSRWPGMLPASFLFDREGKLRYFWGGEAFEKEIVPVVEGFVAGKLVDGEANFGLAPGKVEN